MTSVPRTNPKRNDTRKYSPWSWFKAYAINALTLPLWAGLWIFAKLVPKLPAPVTAYLLLKHYQYTGSRAMDFRIPPDDSVAAYMERWWRIPRNALSNIYFHIVRRSDDDRAHHCHPWKNFSIVLEGGYWEHTISAGGVENRVWFGPGSVRCRFGGKIAHRLELPTNINGYDEEHEMPARTIFLTGPVMRRWGFHDGIRGWVDAYDWDDHCEEYGLTGMKMSGGSDAAVSPRNKLTK